MNILRATLLLILGIPNTLLSGFILAKLWSWFIQPKFGGPTVSPVEGIGIAYTVHSLFFTKWASDSLVVAQKDMGEDEKFAGKIIFFPTVAFLMMLGLGMAYVWKQFL